MDDIKWIEGGICAAAGFKAAGLHAGFRMNKSKKDLALIISDTPCSAAAVYTQNKVKGAPIAVTKNNLANGRAQAMLCNSGNANTCNPNGVEVAEACCALVEKATGIVKEDIIIASTGVIGQELTLEPFEKGIPALAAAASQAGADDAAEAILTTDTVKKAFAVSFMAGGKPCRLGGIAKGSGMIHPNMATMLAFLTTDAAITPAMLQKALAEAVTLTLNQISIDGDTSTNDMASIMASGLAGNAPIEADGPDYASLLAALTAVLTAMAKALAADGEGATKLLSCTVTGAETDELARLIAKTVISSDLFKAAMFGADANWGRALCAIGYTPGDFSAEHVALTLKSRAGEVQVCKESAYFPYSEEEAAKVLAEKEIDILISMGSGAGKGMAWGCDLSYDYVKINGDYRS